MTKAEPALTFDPRYVDFVIQAWQEHDLAPLEANELKAFTRAKAKGVLTEFNAMGFHEENVSDTDIARSLSLLKSLKLTKDANYGPKGAKTKKVTPTPIGQEAFADASTIGWVRKPIVKLLATENSKLGTLISILEQSKPLILPILHSTPNAPKKKDALQKALQTGLVHFGEMIHQEILIDQIFTGGSKKLTSAQAIKIATDIAINHHPLGKVNELLKIIPLAEQLGLLWSDIHQVSDVVAVKSIGSAAIKDSNTYVPNAPIWEDLKSQLMHELTRIGNERAGESGFMTIEALRGGLGCAFHISPGIIDALLCQTREETDKHNYDIQLYFEENEEAISMKGRQPLIWRGRTYDFVTVITKSPEAESRSTSIATAH